MFGFTGTRSGMTPDQAKTIRGILVENEVMIVNHGDCVGADAQFDDIARSLGIVRRLYPSNLESMRAHCESRGASLVTYPAPPLVRNEWILRASEALIAAPKEYHEQLRSGTWSTIRKASKMRLRVLLVYPNGSIRD